MMREPGIPDHLTPLKMACPQRLDGRWRSDQHDDGYRGGGNARQEVETVFHRACQVDELFQNHISVVAELGFGAGLSILETIQRFRQVASPHARLCLISLEQFPIDPNVLKEMLMHDGAAPDLVSALIDQWPIHVGGWHRLSFLEGRVHLTLGLGDAADLLPTMNFKADAWFLDGFSPAKNPDLWTPKVLKMVTDRSASGARLGTWCSAGDVRRTLTELGWAVERVPGHATKRHRLEARRSGTTPNRPSPGKIHIGGAGFAGAGAARAFAERGWSVTVFDTKGPATGASGNPRSLVQPRLAKGLDAASHLHLHAALFAARQMDQLGVPTRDGALHLKVGHHGAKVEAALGHAGMPDALIRAVDEDEASKLAGFRVGSGAWFASARSVSGPEYVAALLDHDNIEVRPDETMMTRLEETPVVWCTGSNAVDALGLSGLHRIRGQLEFLTPIAGLNHAICFGHYLLPGEKTLVLGASYDHGDSDPEVREDTAQMSLELARAALPGVSMHRTGGRTSFRLASRDRLPLLGPDPQGRFWCSLAHGSRGASTGPFLGAFLADCMEGVPGVLPSVYVDRLRVGRFKS
jgi:tRNA 5-methylaminomethyl-2-thiouridine biosynthesis bifunctional protein